MAIEILGLLGGLSFAISGVPTAYKAVKEGCVLFIPKITQWSVFVGSVAMLYYLCAVNGFDWIVILDYTITIVCWGLILKYEYFPRKLNKGDKSCD